ncbi:hypothetical protein [Candidatus Methanomassiliicoccus intestinalis]|uniref:hypothetical protein n=1 Tax=Candidatus Methanomassiliicoccus intestinalis TaxID=1406512 RepID=UPI0037DCDE12
MPAGCRIEISYINPETYASIVNHELRKEILRTLYAMALDKPPTKQELADKLGMGYHQVSYQLGQQLAEFWKVVDEKKVRGTRMEYIAPSSPSAVYITLGKDGELFVVDPLANIFGQLSKVGTRCDGCSEKEYTKCLAHVAEGCFCGNELSEEEVSFLNKNGRKKPFRPMDLALVCALKGITSGRKCVISIPCESCPFMRRAIVIDGL